MPRSFDMAAEYPGSVDRVHRAFSEEPYWLARLADSGADDATLDSLEVSDGAIGVCTTQVLRADRLPGVVSQFHRGDLVIKREEQWGPIREGRATGTISGAIPGAPASLTATMALAPAGAGARQQATVTVEVRIPLLGGKIEEFIGKGLLDLIVAEQRFTSVWITENG